MHICNSGYLCRYYYIIIPYVFSSFYCLKNFYTSDICHVIFGVGVKIATAILCESDGCHCKLPVSR